MHDDVTEQPTALERDVLLASSGELPWWRRLTLAARLRRDPVARRLAETLAVADMTLAPLTAPAGRRVAGVPWIAAGGLVTACAMVVTALVMANRAAETTSPDALVPIDGFAGASVNEDAEALVFSILAGSEGLGGEPDSMPASERIFQPIPEPPVSTPWEFTNIPKPPVTEEN